MTRCADMLDAGEAPFLLAERTKGLNPKWATKEMIAGCPLYAAYACSTSAIAP
jgi:hypothetical protein